MHVKHFIFINHFYRSVFAFMGDGGLLRKDNELTLSIIEETLSALFNAIQKTNGNVKHLFNFQVEFLGI